MVLFLQIIIFLLLLSFLFFTHELGHFLAAKKANMVVTEFGFGFPPRLLKWRKGETIYSLNLIPFGAFVQILGQDEPKNQHPRSYWSQSVGRRFLTAIGGIASNLVWAWLLLTLVLWIQVVTPPKNFIVIEEVVKNSPAEQVGLKVGDLIIKGDGLVFETAAQLSQFTRSHLNKEVTLVVRRFGKEIEKKVKLTGKPDAPLGIAMSETSTRLKIPFWKTPIEAAIILGESVYLSLAYLGKAFLSIFKGPKIPFEVGGPVAIWGLVAQFNALGPLYLLRLAAFLSLGLAIFNFFPFPGLDGARLFFLSLEKLLGKKLVRPEMENAIHGFGFVILIGLSFFIAYKDILRLMER